VGTGKPLLAVVPAAVPRRPGLRGAADAYEVSKSAIKFPLDQPVPVELIRDMARYRAEENLRRERRRGKG
jgi:uncharacterized protein YdhG (YjbR/CyaY superfamily)